MNVLEIKTILDSLIDLLEEMIESAGMENDPTWSLLEEEKQTFLKAKEELSELINTDIHPHFLPKILKEYVPSLDLNLFEQYLQSLKSREELRLKALKENISLYTNILGVMENNED